MLASPIEMAGHPYSNASYSDKVVRCAWYFCFL